nr:ribonuclease H-like domain-containing protein [Tanacetum cinerariifolium]
MAGDDNHDGDHPETSNTTPPVPPPTQQILHTVLSIKLPILKKGKYDIWSMKMEHYLNHTDYPIWQRKERKARTTLLMALPEDHLAKFHKMADAKKMWEAIKSRFEGLHKEYDRFQTLLSQLEIHGAGVSHEDANQKFLRVFERDVKGTTASSSNTQNVAFVSADNTSSTNDVSTAYSVSSPFVSKSQKEGSLSYTDEVIHSFFANQLSAPQLDYDALEQINDDDMEKMDLKWQDDSKALVTIDGEDIDCSGHVEKDAQNYAMMAYYSSNSGSDNNVKSCSKACEESYARLKKLYDEQRDKIGDASIEITAYTLALKKVETQLLCHQQNQLAYEQKIRFMKLNLDDKTDVLAYHKKLLAEALKEKEDLKTKFNNWQNSSKNLSRLLNTQLSANDKFGLGYGDYRYGSILSYENKVFQSVFINKASDLEDTCVNDRYADGMHATLVDESDSKPSEYASCESDSSVETTTSMPQPVEKTSKVVCEPKVWNDAPIIEECESDSDNDSVFNVQEDKEKPSFAFTDSAKHVKTSRKNVKETITPNHINDARQAYSSQATSTSTASKVNTARPFVNETRLKRTFYKTHSPNKRPFHNTTAQRTTFSYHKVNTVDNKSLSAVKGNWDTAVKASAGIKREYSIARTSQQNGVAERKNMTLIEAARTMLADSFLPTTFWAEAVNTACYVLNRVLVTKPQNKTPYELLTVENQANNSAGPKEDNNSVGTQANDDQGANSEEIDLHKEHFVLLSQVEQIFLEEHEKLKSQEKKANDAAESLRKEATHDIQNANTSSTSLLNTVSTPLSVAGPSRAFNNGEPSYPDDPSRPHLEDIYASPSKGIFTDSSYDDEGVVTNFNNLETTMNVCLTPTTRIHTIHPKT